MTVPTQHLISLRHALAVARTKGMSRTAAELEAIIRDLESKEPLVSVVSPDFQVHSGAAVKLPRARSPITRTFPVTRRVPHPLAWQHALRLAHGDASRLVVEDGGGVTVHNMSRHARRS